MSQPRLFLVDVFAEKPMAGNQLAVVVGAPAAEWPTERMQAFAREMNFSETTFVAASATGGAFDTRIFTPGEELPFAGHPTLGTAWVLARFFHEPAPARVVLRLGVGEVPVEFLDAPGGPLVRMTPRPPVVGPVLDASEVAAGLGLSPGDVDASARCRRVSVGMDFAILPLRDREALDRAKPVYLLQADGRPLFVLAVARGGEEAGGDVSARMFFDANGLREDPATGSAAACLAAWIAAERWLGSNVVDACVHQGYRMGRPSSLYITSRPDGDAFAVTVAGRVQLVAEGVVA